MQQLLLLQGVSAECKYISRATSQQHEQLLLHVELQGVHSCCVVHGYTRRTLYNARASIQLEPMVSSAVARRTRLVTSAMRPMLFTTHGHQRGAGLVTNDALRKGVWVHMRCAAQVRLRGSSAKV